MTVYTLVLDILNVSLSNIRDTQIVRLSEHWPVSWAGRLDDEVHGAAVSTAGVSCPVTQPSSPHGSCMCISTRRPDSLRLWQPVESPTGLDSGRLQAQRGLPQGMLSGPGHCCV